MDILSVISKAEVALNLLQTVKPMLGSNAKYLDTATDVIGKALSGAKFGAEGYAELVNELNGVIEDLNAIKARGGLTAQDFTQEVKRIETRGDILDAIKDRLQG